MHYSSEGLTTVPPSVSDTVIAKEILFRKYNYFFSWTRRTSPMPIAFILWGTLRFSTITVSQKLFCFFSHIIKDVCYYIISNFPYKKGY